VGGDPVDRRDAALRRAVRLQRPPLGPAHSRLSGEFDGPAFHAHAYSDPFDPVDMRGKNVVVVGMGNSAMDIASELAQRPIAKNLWVSARRGVWVFPKYLNGKPSDKSAMPAWMPRKLGLKPWSAR
jgi:cation diffusion facilitator CzcD-associated flavoprotein CzcO